MRGWYRAAMWEFLTSSTSPWWTGLMGAVIGGAISNLASRANEERKAKREANARWVSQVQELSTEVITLSLEIVNRVNDVRQQWRRSHELMPPTKSADRDARLDALMQEIWPLKVRMNGCTANLHILRAGSIAEAGDSLGGIVSRIGPTSEPEEWKASMADLVEAQKTFIDLVQELSSAPSHKALGK